MLYLCLSLANDQERTCVQTAALLNLAVMLRMLQHIPMELQMRGAQIIREVLSRCVNPQHEQLIRNLVSVAHGMLYDFTASYTQYGYEQSGTRYFPIANLLDLEGEGSAKSLIIPSLISIGLESNFIFSGSPRA